MVREDLKKRSSFAGRAIGLLLVNSLPIAGFAYLGWRYYDGTLSLDAIPEGAAESGAVAGIGLAVLFMVASLLLPAVHAAARSFSNQMRWSRDVRSHAGVLRVLLECLLWPFRFVLWFVFAALRFVLIVAAFALIALILFFVIRLIYADMGNEWPWIGDGLEWLNGLRK